MHSLGGGGLTVFENVTVVGGPLVLSSQAEVDAAESELGLQFLYGYREYVTQFGEGVLGGTYIRIYPPRRILAGDNNLLDGDERSMSTGSGTMVAMYLLKSKLSGQ